MLQSVPLKVYRWSIGARVTFDKLRRELKNRGIQVMEPVLAQLQFSSWVLRLVDAQSQCGRTHRSFVKHKQEVVASFGAS